MLCDDLVGWDGGSERGLLPGEGIYAYIQLIHIVVRPKRAQHCKSVMLQLKDKPVLCDHLERGSWEGGGGGFQEGRMQVCLWLVHGDVWQRPSQYCKVVILRLK